MALPGLNFCETKEDRNFEFETSLVCTGQPGLHSEHCLKLSIKTNTKEEMVLKITCDTPTACPPEKACIYS